MNRVAPDARTQSSRRTPGRHRRVRRRSLRELGTKRVAPAVAGFVAAMVLIPILTNSIGHPSSPLRAVSESSPPPAHAIFAAVAPHDYGRLPSGSECAELIRRSSWEPRPDNYVPNHTTPDPAMVARSFAARPRSTADTYDPRWDSWLLPRVDGQFTGTTDEIIQWAACKWGLNDNLLRAILVRESTWFQYETYPSGRCVTQRGCGDLLTDEAQSQRRTYCDELARYGHDYQDDYGVGRCPKTFSIAGVMSWWSPDWGFDWPGNQNGVFPYSRDSTAFAVDYLAADLRGCFQGWKLWLHDRPGDIWGCVGSWYAGDWRSVAAEQYIRGVRELLHARVWLTPSWVKARVACSAAYGCPDGPS
jgi:hypothetical protein